ncbi:MAG: hypothetical protein LUH00_00385 [Lachnospiraceae bacterium]|nr:hypothetical protein [Lachnospiraceae bacterium]
MAQENGKKKMTTSQLLNLIKRSNDFSEVKEAYHDNTEDPVFCHYLYQLMEKHGVAPKDIIVESGIERSYFYHVQSGKKMPGRNIILRIAFCMSATYAETSQMLRLAGQGALYPRVRRDAILIYAIEKKLTMQQANDMLLQEKELPLYERRSKNLSRESHRMPSGEEE